MICTFYCNFKMYMLVICRNFFCLSLCPNLSVTLFDFTFSVSALSYSLFYAYISDNEEFDILFKNINLGCDITTWGQRTNLKVSTSSDPFLAALVDFLYLSGTRLSEKISFYFIAPIVLSWQVSWSEAKQTSLFTFETGKMRRSW